MISRVSLYYNCAYICNSYEPRYCIIMYSVCTKCYHYYSAGVCIELIMHANNYVATHIGHINVYTYMLETWLQLKSYVCT